MSPHRSPSSKPALVLTLALALVPVARGAPPAPPEPEDGTPRATVGEFLDLGREGRYAEAARLLELTRAQEARGPELARRLKAVVDRNIWFDLETLSDSPAGNTSDGLAPNLEEVGRIPRAHGSSDPVRLVRVERGGRAAWLFSAATVRHVDAWYAQLPGRWALDHLPPSLVRSGPRDLLWWQWMALPLLMLAAWLLSLAVAGLTTRLLARAARRTRYDWDDALVARLRGPVRFAWWFGLLAIGTRSLELYAPAQRFVDTVLVTGIALDVFWALLRSTEILGEAAQASGWARTHPGGRALLPLAFRAGKVAIVVLAVVQLLSMWGFPVTTLVAGLGIGGVALALAAQKTVENVFGAFSIGVDQPFREGDFVKVEDFVGTVESIGLRSTRIRTLDRTLISLPNGKLADTRVESFAARDRIRLACTIGLVYGTTAAQLRTVLAGLEGVLRRHPKIWPEAVVVRFKELAAASLDIEVMAWFQTSDWGEFQAIRQDVLLAFMEVVEAAGSSFAFPTQTIHVESVRRAPRRAADAPALVADPPERVRSSG